MSRHAAWGAWPGKMPRGRGEICRTTRRSPPGKWASAAGHGWGRRGSGSRAGPAERRRCPCESAPPRARRGGCCSGAAARSVSSSAPGAACRRFSATVASAIQPSASTRVSESAIAWAGKDSTGTPSSSTDRERQSRRVRPESGQVVQDLRGDVLSGQCGLLGPSGCDRCGRDGVGIAHAAVGQPGRQPRPATAAEGGRSLVAGRQDERALVDGGVESTLQRPEDTGEHVTQLVVARPPGTTGARSASRDRRPAGQAPRWR